MTITVSKQEFIQKLDLLLSLIQRGDVVFIDDGPIGRMKLSITPFTPPDVSSTSQPPATKETA